MAAQELPNIIGRKSKHPLLEYLFINIFFPPLAYFLLWKHHAPLKPLAKFTLINSFFFICYFVPALFSFVVAMSALDHKNILHNPSLLSQTILFTGIGVFVTSSGEYNLQKYVITDPGSFPTYFTKKGDMHSLLQFWLKYKKENLKTG
jgi:hypothetical protein